ncbi:hypothetical protein GE09DRAFT_1211438 [Coniochaeta sp. 2T2.1]|nr:hypothetical protein GE09DRAFT_1211438 [Coniochaeta sp. 2T2.1]
MVPTPTSTDSTFGHLSPWGKISLFLRLPLLLVYIPYLYTTSLATTPNLHWQAAPPRLLPASSQSRLHHRPKPASSTDSSSLAPRSRPYCTSNEIPYRKVTPSL